MPLGLEALLMMPDGTIFLRIFPLWRQVHDAKHYAHCNANQMLLSSVTAQLVCMQVRFINAAAPHIAQHLIS